MSLLGAIRFVQKENREHPVEKEKKSSHKKDKKHSKKSAKRNKYSSDDGEESEVDMELIAKKEIETLEKERESTFVKPLEFKSVSFVHNTLEYGNSNNMEMDNVMDAENNSRPSNADVAAMLRNKLKAGKSIVDISTKSNSTNNSVLPIATNATEVYQQHVARTAMKDTVQDMRRQEKFASAEDTNMDVILQNNIIKMGANFKGTGVHSNFQGKIKRGKSGSNANNDNGDKDEDVGDSDDDMKIQSHKRNKWEAGDEDSLDEGNEFDSVDDDDVVVSEIKREKSSSSSNTNPNTTNNGSKASKSFKKKKQNDMKEEQSEVQYHSLDTEDMDISLYTKNSIPANKGITSVSGSGGTAAGGAGGNVVADVKAIARKVLQQQQHEKLLIEKCWHCKCIQPTSNTYYYNNGNNSNDNNNNNNNGSTYVVNSHLIIAMATHTYIRLKPGKD